MFPSIGAIKAKAEANGYAPAIINGERVLSYGELLDLIARISNHLADRRIERGQRVFLNIRDPDLRLAALLAAIHYGIIPYVLGEPGDLRPGTEYDLVIGAPVPLAPDLPADLKIDETVLQGRLSDGKLRDFPDRGDDEILLIGGTSGTTGRRKLVVQRTGRYKQIAFGNPVNGLHMQPETGRLLLTLGDASLPGVYCAMILFFQRNALVRPDPDPATTLRHINLYRITHISASPALLGVFAARMESERIRCPSVQEILLTGALLPKPLVEQVARVFPGVRVDVAYGSSEAGIVSRGYIDPATFRVGFAGTVMPYVRMLSVGTPGAPAPLTVVNELDRYAEYYVDGRIVPHEQTSYAMPDHGYIEDGVLYLLGRQDEVLNLGGNKHAFSTIESAIRQDPAIADVGLVNLPPELSAGGLIIAVAGGQAIDATALLARVTGAIGAPAAAGVLHVRQLPAIPRNAMGKVDREAIIRNFRTGPVG